MMSRGSQIRTARVSIRRVRIERGVPASGVGKLGFWRPGWTHVIHRLAQSIPGIARAATGACRVACLASSVGQFRRPWARYCVAAPYHSRYDSSQRPVLEPCSSELASTNSPHRALDLRWRMDVAGFGRGAIRREEASARTALGAGSRRATPGVGFQAVVHGGRGLRGLADGDADLLQAHGHVTDRIEAA